MNSFHTLLTIFFGLILFVIFNQVQANELFLNRNVWVYWDKQINKAPILVQLCLQKIKMVSQQEGWELVLLTQQNLHQYIPNYQTEFLQVKAKRQHPEWTAGLADLIRLSVLEEHGGVWFDISTILTHGLNWLENLERIPYLLANSDIQKGNLPDLLIPYLSYYQSISQRRDSEGKIQKFLPGYEAWFIAGKKKAPPLTEWRKRYIEHITTPGIVNRKIEIQKGYFTKHLKGEYLNVDKAMNQIIEEKQFEIDRNLTLFEARKNANKQLNIVGFHGQYGPFLIYLNFLPQKDMVLTHTFQQIEEQFYITINFFVKFTGADRPYFDKKVQRLIKLFGKYESFEKYMESDPSLEDCKQIAFIVEDSVFGRLIKNNKLATGKNLYPITKSQRQVWTNHCKLRFDAENKNNKMNNACGGEIKSIWDWLCIHHVINIETRSAMNYYFQQMNWMGRISIDLEQLYYWKKIYQEKYLENNQQRKSIKNIRGVYSQQEIVGQNLQVQKQKRLNEENIKFRSKPFSKLTLQEKFKYFTYSFVMKNKPFIIKFYQILGEYYPLFYQFTAVTLLSFLAYKILLKAFKLKFRPMRKFYFHAISIGKYRKNNDLLKRIWSKINCLKKNNFIKIFISILLVSSRVIRNFFISLIFIFFQVFIIEKFIRICIDGDTDFQEAGLIGIMLTQIAFRKIIFDFLSPKSWFIPGISLQLLYRIFLPVYRVCLGRCIIEFAERRQEWNFGLMFPICLGLPPIINEIEFQVKKLIKNEESNQKSHKKGLVQRLKRNWGMIFSNLSGICEGVVLGFLILCYNVPNIRYMYVGEELLMRRIVGMVWEFEICLFFILMVLYVLLIFGSVKKIVQKWKNNCFYQKINLQEYSSEQASDQFDMKSFSDEGKPTQSQINHESYDTIQNTNKNVKQTFQRVKKIFNDLMSVLLNLTRYAINSYILFKLTISPCPDFVYRNVEQIWKDRVLEVLLLLVINFQVQNVFLQQFYKFDIKEPSSKQTNQETQLQLQRNFEKRDHFSNQNWCILANVLLAFQIVRLYVFEQLFGYFDVINASKYNLKQGFENEWPLYNTMIITFTFGGYWLLKLIHHCFEERNVDVNKNELDEDNGGELMRSCRNQEMRDLDE